MLGSVLAAVASPGYQQQAGDPVEEVKGAEGVQRHPETRVLHDDDGQPAAEVRSGRDAERGVLARLRKIETAPLQLGDHRADERAGHPDEEIEASGLKAIDEGTRRPGRWTRRSQRASSAHARRYSSKLSISIHPWWMSAAVTDCPLSM